MIVKLHLKIDLYNDDQNLDELRRQLKFYFERDALIGDVVEYEAVATWPV